MNTTAFPRLRDEVIVRPFDGGGKQSRYVVAIDGQHFIVAPAVAAILDEARHCVMSDGVFETLAQRVSHRLGTCITPRQVETLMRERVPKALFESTTGIDAERSPLIWQRLLFSGTRLKSALALASPLFTLRVAIGACALVVLIDVLVALQASGHGLEAAGIADYSLSLALTVAGIFIHELGHLCACHRFGARHGGIGCGIYWCLPAFYAEVHGAWTLQRIQRAAVDAGGVYLQFLFCGVLGVLYLLSLAPALLSAIVLSHLLMLHTLNPVLKFDGYWLLSDLTGIHNLHRRVRDTARGLLHRRHVPRGEAALFASFVIIALAYLAYLLAVLGQNLGWSAASFSSAIAAADLSLPALLPALGKGALLALMLTMAFGIASALGRAGEKVLTETPNEH